jgi:hypothetical protein
MYAVYLRSAELLTKVLRYRKKKGEEEKRRRKKEKKEQGRSNEKEVGVVLYFLL